MKTKTRSIGRIIEEQVQRWQLMQNAPATPADKPLITISREPGSGGRLVADALAEQLKIDVFHQEIVHAMADSADASKQLLATLDEKGLSVLDNWVASMVSQRHLWPDEYLQHLMKVIGTIGKHGSAVIVGRGANFILPADKRFAVRIVAPLSVRVARVCETFGAAQDAAKRRVLQTDANRKAFVRKYFHADIADPINYDLLINTGNVQTASAANAIVHAMARV